MCASACFDSYSFFLSSAYLCHRGCGYFFVIMGMQLLDIVICQAAANGRNDCMQVLLAAGADKEAKDKTGSTALMHVSIRFDAHSEFLDVQAPKMYFHNYKTEK